MKVRRVAKKEDLKNSLLLANHAQDGDFCIVEETNEGFKFENGKWMPWVPTVDGKGPQISLYELNRSMMRSQPNYQQEEIQKLIADFNEYHEKEKNKYYMLLSIETSYYTVFNNEPLEENDLKDFGSAILAISLAIGPIVGHEICDDHAEIWFRSEKDNEVYIHMLFPYDGGVVTFG